MLVPSIQIKVSQSVPQCEHQKPPQYKAEVSVGIDKETNDKVEDLERQLKQIKGTDSLGSINFNDLYIHPGLKFPTTFKCLDFEKYDGKNCPYAHLKVCRVAMALYGDNN